MKKVYVRSMSLPKGVPVMEYENLAEIQAGGGNDLQDYMGFKTDRITACLNMYLHQKGSLPENKEDFGIWIELVAKFPWLTTSKTVKKDGKDVVEVKYEETEAGYIDRFVAAVVTGKRLANYGSKELVPYTPPAELKLTATGADDTAKTKSVWEYLQNLIEKPLEVTINGKVEKIFSYANDIKLVIRVAKAKTPPQYCIDAANRIIANKNQAKWIKTFTDEGVPFQPFDTADAAANVTNLAWAVQAREKAQADKKYA